MISVEVYVRNGASQESVRRSVPRFAQDSFGDMDANGYVLRRVTREEYEAMMGEGILLREAVEVWAA